MAISKGKKAMIISSLVLAVLLIAAGEFFFRYYFVFGEGVKAGELNRIVYKGYVFKTYEGYIIQSGFKSNAAAGKTGVVNSIEFAFSVEDKAVADSLMYHCGGRQVELHYKEYKGALPWRGKEKFIVDKIVAVH